MDLSFAGINQTLITNRGPPSTDTPLAYTLVDNVLGARIARIYDDLGVRFLRVAGQVSGRQAVTVISVYSYCSP